MVKHVILWKLKDELAGEEKEQVKAGIKEGLEGLAGQIPGHPKHVAVADSKVRPYTAVRSCMDYEI